EWLEASRAWIASDDETAFLPGLLPRVGLDEERPVLESNEEARYEGEVGNVDREERKQRRAVQARNRFSRASEESASHPRKRAGLRLMRRLSAHDSRSCRGTYERPEVHSVVA